MPKTKMAAPMNSVELGFAEEAEKHLLRSRFFPSKIGGYPAWLSLKPLPSPEDLLCNLCGKPLKFLMQVYSPDSSNASCFHRTVFLFICGNEQCCQPNTSENIKAFCSQLSKVNDFYSTEPPVERPVETEITAESVNKICRVCGCLGSKTCSKCHKVNYCSREHQTIDWKGGHKQECSDKLTGVNIKISM